MNTRSLLLSIAIGVPLVLSLLWEYPGHGQDRPDRAPAPPIIAQQPDAQADHPDGPASPILYRGTESRLVTYAAPKGKKGGGAGLDLPTDFVVDNFALSRDGQCVWVVLWNWGPYAKSSSWQLWRLRTDGTEAKQAEFVLSPKIAGRPTVRTNGDGTVAWIWTQKHEPHWEIFHLHLQQIKPGAAPKVVVDTKNVKGITNGWDPQVTADGKSLFFIAREGLVQVRDNGAVNLVQAKKDIVYQGKSLAESWPRNLAINADGSHWAATSRLDGLKDPKMASLIVWGTPKGIRLHGDTTFTFAGWGIFSGVGISQDGTAVLMEREVPKDGHYLHLWQGDQVKPVSHEVAEVFNGILSGNGKALYAVCGYRGNSGSNQLSGFVEQLPTGQRHLAMTGALLVYHRGSHQLSSDGKVLAAYAPFSSQTSSCGLYIYREGTAPVAHPQMKSVRQRYEGTKLIVTVETDAPDGLGRVALLPLKNGYLQPAHFFKKPEDNPLQAFGVHLRNFVVDPKRPGVYQMTVDLGPKHAPLDDSFSLRIVAVNEAGNRTTFVDVPVLGSGDKVVGKNNTFRTFAEHLQDLDKAKFEDYKGRPGVKVTSAAEFNKMKAHLQSLYTGVKATHTFIGNGGRHVDCVTLDKQPGALAELKRGRKLQLTPPAMPGTPKFAKGKTHPATAQGLATHLKKGTKDKHGKEMFCAEGIIPMLRITLNDVTRFATLRHFLQKHPSGSHLPPTPKNKAPGGRRALPEMSRGGPDFSGHRYAHAFQVVDNIGGSSWLNLWNVTPTPHQFSLSQQWYSGGDPLQTVEGGWQVFPDMYGNNLPVLFVYWTADYYNNTGGYNLTTPGFIQVDNSFVLGLYWDGYSASGGQQWGFRMTWYRDPTTGNWWLYLQGPGDPVAVGYYPQSLFGNGQMSQFATQIDFGGEVTGQPSTGQMGSGSFANAGWQRAAFQREIYYLPTSGPSTWASLTGTVTHPNYYTIDVHNADMSGGSWGTFFYFGGPGGQ